MTDADQRRTLRELLRDAIEIARSAAAASKDEEAIDVFDSVRPLLANALGVLDDFETRERAARPGA